MKRIFLILILLFFAGCSQPDPLPSSEETICTMPNESEPTVSQSIARPDPILTFVGEMSVPEKVGQIFLARYDHANALSHIEQYHPGGWILFGGDIEGHTPKSLSAQIAALQQASSIPMLIAVDEEGGTVTRISRYPAFRANRFSSPRKLYQSGGTELLLQTEAEKSQLLHSLGLNVNMAPVCDITTDRNAFMYSRSLGQSPDITAQLISRMVQTMDEHHIGSVLKHFPGYGNNVDTHVGIARDTRSLAALEGANLVPFRAGIQAGCGAILVSHTIVEALDDTMPASLSPAVIAYLRDDMGFDGVVVTDDLVMQAITDTYGAGEAAVLAVQAGCDLLCSTEYTIQYDAVLSAVTEGRIPMERLDEAVIRILRWKQNLGLIQP